MMGSMPETSDRVQPGLLQRKVAELPKAAINVTAAAAELSALPRGWSEKERLKSAALDLISEAVDDYGRVDEEAEKATKLWRVEAKAMAEKKARDESGVRVPDLEKNCLVEIVAREISRPYQYAKDRDWSPDMRAILKQAALPGAFDKDGEKEKFSGWVRRSFDLTSLVNQKMPWRLFCQLNLSAPVGETEKEEEKSLPEVMRATYMSSRSIDNLFRPVGLEDKENMHEATEAATKLADVCLLEAVLGEVAEGVKSWDLAAADKAGELSPMEELLSQSGLGLDPVVTGVNRGFVWKADNKKVSRTESVVTDSRVSYLDRNGRYWIFDATTDRGRVGRILDKPRILTNDEIILGLVFDLGNDPVAIGKRTNLPPEEVLPMIARVRSIPTLVTHAGQGIQANSTIEAFSLVRREAQKEAGHRGRLNGMIIVGGINWRMGEYHITTVHNHAVRDGVEAAAMTARLADRFQVGLEEVSAGLSVENKAGALIYNFAGDEELMKVDLEFFLVDPAHLHLGEIFPSKTELGELPGEEVSFAVDVRGMWQQAMRISGEFGKYRDSNRKGEKTILTSPYFVMEMMIQQMHQDISKTSKLGVLLAKRGMQDLDLHPMTKGLDVLKVSELMRDAGKDATKRKELDGFLSSYMDQVKKDLTMSNMALIEKVARVAGPPVRRLVNAISLLPVMKPGVRAMEGVIDMLSIVPGIASVTHGVAMDGPAMYEAQDRAITVSGFIKTNDGGMAIVVTVKRNARPGQKARKANQRAHDFTRVLHTLIESRESRLGNKRLNVVE